MNIKKLITFVQNDVRQEVYEKEEILLLCEKAEKMRKTLENIRYNMDFLSSEVNRLVGEVLEEE